MGSTVSCFVLSKNDKKKVDKAEKDNVKLLSNYSEFTDTEEYYIRYKKKSNNNSNLK